MQVKFSIYRYNPDVDSKPKMQEMSLEVPEGSDMMVLDALIQLKETDASLSFRRSCREGVCGSDGVNMNGKNGLACITPCLIKYEQYDRYSSATWLASGPRSRD